MTTDANTSFANALNGMPASIAALHQAALKAGFNHIWRGPVPNEWTTRDSHKIEALVFHVEESSEESADSWFHNSNAQASADFGITLDGTIHQWVPVEFSAWGNGIVNNPDTSIGWIARNVANGINLNEVSISIEHEGYHGDVHPDAQKKAGAWLAQYLCSQYAIPFDQQHLSFHCQIDSVNRVNCPGDDLKTFYTQLAINGNGGPVIVNPTPAPAPAPTFNVGGGILAAMTKLGDSPATNERYLTYKDTGEEISEAHSVTRVYQYIKATGQVNVYLKTGIQF